MVGRRSSFFSGRSSSPRAPRAAAALLLVALAAAPGCKKSAPSTPEGVADAFVEAYFRQMDQQRAKEFTALGATKMLETELKEVQDVRKDGYEPASVNVAVHRGESAPRDERIRIPYEIDIQTDSGTVVRDADVELARIDGAWKVVRVGVKARDAAPQTQ
ncbi:MAG: hypothetical protein U0441_31455 [Polyangiaceae bacterium]